MTLAIIAALTLFTPPRLGICDKAPALGFGVTLKGSPVRTFSPQRVTVVEFWATWCKPCIAFMPHLSELWSKYRDRADFVSVSVMENDASQLKPFVDSMGDKMAYPVVADKVDAKGKGFMNTSWLRAAGQNAIPVAFIVGKDARIAWIGNPVGMESILAKVIDGTWDAKAYRTRFNAIAKDEEASDRLMRDGYDRLSSTARNHSYAATLNWIERNRSKYEGPDTQAALDEFKKLFTAFKSANYAAALKQAETAPASALVWNYFRPMLLVARIDALQCLDRTDESRDVALKTIDGPPDPNLLMGLIDALTLPESKLAQKDPNFALKAAEKLAGLARVPMFLVRLAWAHHANGQIEEAKATLEEAFQKMDVEKKRNPKSYDGMLARLKRAKAHFDKE